MSGVFAFCMIKQISFRCKSAQCTGSAKKGGVGPACLMPSSSECSTVCSALRLLPSRTRVSKCACAGGCVCVFVCYGVVVDMTATPSSIQNTQHSHKN